MKSHASSDRIDDEASLWAARLDSGAMSASDKAAFSAWLSAHAEHRRVFESYRALSTQLDQHIDTRLGKAVEAATHDRAAARNRVRTITALVAAAAAIFVFVSLVLNRPLNLATETAERHITSLDDGSRVELNARTKLIVDFQRDERRVRLVSGEALFNVAKDSTRPFLVETPAGSVRVTGTQFNVRTTTADRIEVTILEGTVRVKPPGETTSEQSVTAGLQAVITAGSVTVRTLPDGAAQDVIAWRQGQAVFEDTPLSEAIERFAAYHARTITVDPAVADLRLGGRFSLEDLNGLLESIESVLPVRVAHGPGHAVRISAGEHVNR